VAASSSQAFGFDLLGLLSTLKATKYILTLTKRMSTAYYMKLYPTVLAVNASGQILTRKLRLVLQACQLSRAITEKR
jgi:hypothetical protein